MHSSFLITKKHVYEFNLKKAFHGPMKNIILQLTEVRREKLCQGVDIFWLVLFNNAVLH